MHHDPDAQPQADPSVSAIHHRCLIEVCVDSVESALAAQHGGGNRIELCQDLFEGGITPSAGLIEVVRETISLPISVMIRPRGGDFLYTAREFDVMQRDLQLAKRAGADMIVLGVLSADGRVDKDRTGILMDLADPLPVTFHRAFDMTPDPFEALEDLMALGVKRVLTSGQEASVLEGLETLAELIRRAENRIGVMPGGGITERNLPRILTACPVREIHVSASTSLESAMDYRNPRVAMGRRLGPAEYALARTSVERVREFRALAP